MSPLPRRPIATALTLMLLSGAIPAVAEEDAVTRGEYLVHAGGCFSCHTVAGGEKLAGGRALATPFGTSTVRTSHPIRKPVSAAGPTRCFCKHCARACGPTEQTTFRCSHIRASPASATAMPWRSRPICSRSPQCTGKTGRTTCPSHSPGGSCKPAGSCCSSPPVRFNPPPSAVLSIIAGLIWSLRSRIAASAILHAISSAPRNPVSGWPGRRMGRTVSSSPT